MFLELYQCAVGCVENIKFSFEEGNELELETMFLNEQFLPDESENFVFSTCPKRFVEGADRFGPS